MQILTRIVVKIAVYSLIFGLTNCLPKFPQEVVVCTNEDFHDAYSIACSLPPLTMKRKDEMDDMLGSIHLDSFSEKCCEKPCSIIHFMEMCNT